MILDYTSLLIGLVLGIVAVSKKEQARLQRYMSMGKKNMGTVEVKRKGKNMAEYVRNLSVDVVKIPEGSFPVYPNRVYNNGGVPKMFVSENTSEPIDFDYSSNSGEYEIDSECPKCKNKFTTSATISIPVVDNPDPKRYNDANIGFFELGRKSVLANLMPLITAGFIIVGVGVLVAIALGYINMQNMGGLSNGIADLKAAVVAGFNATVTK